MFNGSSSVSLLNFVCLCKQKNSCFCSVRRNFYPIATAGRKSLFNVVVDLRVKKKKKKRQRRGRNTDPMREISKFKTSSFNRSHLSLSVI